MTYLALYAFGAFWTGHAAARATHWHDPVNVVLFALATALWPLFWLFVIIALIAGKLR
jgi:hypothetical protein